MPSRDDRIDLLRGVALIVILVDHLEMVTGQVLFSRFTMRQLEFSDALEGFVFLSGYVFGLAFRRVQKERGFWFSQFKATKRAVELAIANGVCLIAVLTLAWVAGVSPHISSVLRLQETITHPIASALMTVIPGQQPFGFDVLPLYCVILCIAPSLLWLANRRPLIAIFVSLMLYALSQRFPCFPISGDPTASWLYHPLAWQLVFFAGSTVSSSAMRWPSGRSERIVVTAAVIGLLFFLLANTEITQTIAETQSFWLISKQAAGPLRLLHFAFLAISVIALVRRFPNAPSWRVLHLISRCGRHSLAVFLVGLWLTHAAAFFITGSHAAELILFEFNGVVLSITVATLLEKRPRH